MPVAKLTQEVQTDPKNRCSVAEMRSVLNISTKKEDKVIFESVKLVTFVIGAVLHVPGESKVSKFHTVYGRH